MGKTSTIGRTRVRVTADLSEKKQARGRSVTLKVLKEKKLINLEFYSENSM